MKTTFHLSLIICALAAFSGALQLKGSDPDLMPMLDDNITISTPKTSGVVSEEGPTFSIAFLRPKLILSHLTSMNHFYSIQ